MENKSEKIEFCIITHPMDQYKEKFCGGFGDDYPWDRRMPGWPTYPSDEERNEAMEKIVAQLKQPEEYHRFSDMIQIKIAGFTKSEISVELEVHENTKVLFVNATKPKESGSWIKDISLNFNLEPNEEVTDVDLVNGILNVHLFKKNMEVTKTKIEIK